jgi:hypothetical protein
MELDLVEAGFIEHEALVALTREEIKRLRYAMSISVAHVEARYLDPEIFEDFLEVTEGL